jgi:signal transduction histidine kinase
MKWLKYFVPPALQGDPEAVRRAQLTIALAYLLAAFTPLFAAIAFFGYRLGVIAIIDLLGAALAFAAPFVLRATGSVKLASSLVLSVIVLTIALAAGSVEGLTSPALAWLALVPIVSATLGGRRAAAVWAAVCTLTLVALVLLDRIGGVLPNRELPVDARRIAAAWNYALMFGVALSFSALYENLHLRAVAALNQAREELERTRQQAALNERMAALGRLVAGVAHEINNPSTFVAGNVRLARDTVALVRSGAVPATELQEVEAALSDALTGATRITDTVRDLKTLGRASDESTAMVDAADVMDVSLRILANPLRHRATVEKNLAHVASVVANESRLGQVFVNLLTNAADAMPERPAAQNLIKVSTRMRGDEVSIEVEDNGSGIAPDVLPHIFDPFFSTKETGTGTGLGLSICRTLVEQMKGRLEVESMPGRGSLFRVLLPAARRMRVLVIDDDVSMCQSLERLLGRKYQVEHHLSATEALARADLETFDVILCDLLMPEVNGADFYERVQKTRPHLAPRIGFMTGAGVESPGADALRDRLVDKPVETEKLEALLTSLAGRRTGRA